MKKILAICVVLVMVFSLSITAFAAPNGFVSSPSQDDTPVIEDFKPSQDDCTGELIITGYKDIAELPTELREAMEDAFKELSGAADLTDLNEEFKKAVEKKGINSKNLLVSDLFDMHIEGCHDHDGHHDFEIALSTDKLKNFVGLIYRDDNGNWQYVSNAKVIKNGTVLKFSVDDFSPFAIIVHKDITSPQTSNNGAANIYVILAAVAAMVVISVCKKAKKQTA